MTDTQSGRKFGSSAKWAVAAVVLAAGYADLARGGETIAPILLVIGYVVLIPAAILS
jgi:hypothetical protein